MSAPPRFTLTRSTGRQAGSTPTLDRRAALAVLSAGMATALAACAPPRETATPYVQAPEGGAAGVRRRYATTVTLAGYGRGASGVCIDGRPIKLDGSARHPASLGSTDVFTEAAILDLYDPNRLKTPVGPAGVSDWTGLSETLRAQMARHVIDRGAGLVLVTGRITSPSELRQIARLQSAYPAMLWTRFEPVHEDAARTVGEVQRPRYGEADVVLWLGADPLGPGPSQVMNARTIAGRRRPDGRDGSRLSRLYSAEATLSQSGIMADHRLTADPTTQRAILAAVAHRLGGPAPAPSLNGRAKGFADAAADDLIAKKNRALVEVGRAHPRQTHALARWINARLNAPIDALPDPDPNPDTHAEGLEKLRHSLSAKVCTTLVILDCNPGFHGTNLAPLIADAPFSVHFGRGGADETSALCRWRAPLSHPLESWSDARGPDGTASLGQPLIRPLYGTRSALEALAMVAGDDAPDGLALVRASWPAASDEGWWRKALATGVVVEPRPPLRVTAPQDAPTCHLAGAGAGGALILEFIPHPTLWDGRYADNAWLQETPDPVTKEVWGSALRLSAVDARRLTLADGTRVRLHVGEASAEAFVKIVKGQAAGVATLPLGGGRRVAGPIGRGVGTDAAALRGSDLAWSVALDQVEPLGHPVASVNAASFTLDADTAALAPTLTLAALATKAAQGPPPPSLLPPEPKNDHAFAMVIDTAVCIGCNACVAACQSENNLAIVGPEEIAAGRDMHWLRIDRYDPGPSDAEPQPVFTPVPCMQCEQAPCEPVCPVEASVHDHDGLNDQVYNRCVGTRFCEANCPYQVRRFNYRDYSAGAAYGGLDLEPLKAQRNPDVSVRGRGVMEKCTYCTQRIAAAKSESDRTGAPIADGSLQTACASACPTQAITFGDLVDQKAKVNAQRADPRHFALLAELGTRPRTTYLAKVRNPNPALERAR